MNHSPTIVFFVGGRVFVFSWLLQRRTDTATETTIESLAPLTIIQSAADYADAYAQAYVLMQRDSPGYEVISHNCFELVGLTKKAAQ
jgi:hypothetical protein